MSLPDLENDFYSVTSQAWSVTESYTQEIQYQNKQYLEGSNHFLQINEQPCEVSFYEYQKQQNESKSQCYSYRQIPDISCKLSRIHQKYLNHNKNLEQSNRRVSKSDQKASFSSLNQNYTKRKYTKSYKQYSINNKNIQVINPIKQGLNCLQIDRTALASQIGQINKQEEINKCKLIQSLGLKTAKALGKAKTDHILSIIGNFCENGQLPSEYISEFLSLVDKKQ